MESKKAFSVGKMLFDAMGTYGAARSGGINLKAGKSS